jgi:hypothetical protein
MSVHVFVFLLVVYLLFSLARLGRLDWFPFRPSSSPGGAKRSIFHRLLKPHTPPVAWPSLCRRLEGQHLLLFVLGVR